MNYGLSIVRTAVINKRMPIVRPYEEGLRMVRVYDEGSIRVKTKVLMNE